MERYQEALFRDGTVPGERNGEERWSLVSQYLPSHGTLLDVGSNLGYFVVRSAASHPDLAVVSLEVAPHLAEQQRAVLQSQGLSNVVLLQGGLTGEIAARWATACDQFDATLLLSIIHWFDDPELVVASLSSMSGRLICEVPDAADEGACGQEVLSRLTDPVAWFREVTGRNARLVGRMARHTSSVPSSVIVVDGPSRRRPTVPYLGSTYDHPSGRDYLIEHDGESTTMTVRGERSDYIPGVNLHNLMCLGALRYPTPEDVWNGVDSCLRAQPGHPDPLAHNMVWGPAGMTLVDFEDVEALTTAGDARRALVANLAGWQSGSTVVDGVVLRRYSMAQRMRHTAFGRAMKRLVPASVWRRARRLVRRRSR